MSLRGEEISASPAPVGDRCGKAHEAHNRTGSDVFHWSMFVYTDAQASPVT